MSARHLAIVCPLLLAACGQPAPIDGPSPKTHSAAAFHETTTYRLPGGYARSAHDERLLVGTDELGALNVHVLPVSGGPGIALTRATASPAGRTASPPRKPSLAS